MHTDLTVDIDDPEVSRVTPEISPSDIEPTRRVPSVDCRGQHSAGAMTPKETLSPDQMCVKDELRSADAQSVATSQ